MVLNRNEKSHFLRLQVEATKNSENFEVEIRILQPNQNDEENLVTIFTEKQCNQGTSNK